MNVKALKQVQKDKPAFAGEKGARRWWGEVIERTALGAGADPVSKYLRTNITPELPLDLDC